MHPVHRVEEGADGDVGLVTLTSPSGDLSATFAPEAAMLGCSLRHRGTELLGHADGLAAYLERGSTMGIPLLHPWANRLDGNDYEAAGFEVALPAASPLVHRDGNGLPMHGVPATARDWRRTETWADEGGARVAARLDFSARPDVLALFPFRHTVDVEATLIVDTLHVAVTVTAGPDADVPVALGFHPYLQLPDVPRADWEVDLPARRRLVTDARGIPTGASEPVPASSGPLGDTTYDDGYDELGDAPAFVLAGGGRRITTRFVDGFPVAQVYAPADADVICFEPMTAPVDALRTGRRLPVLGPGESLTAAFTITVG